MGFRLFAELSASTSQSVSTSQLLTSCIHLYIITKSMTILYRKLSQLNTLDSQYLMHNLSWSPHISRIVGKVNSVQSFFRRNLAYCPRDLKVKCYQTYIRPIIEYAAVVWSPHTQSSIDAVEILQWKAAKFVCCDFARLSSVTSMLEHLRWDTLEQR